MLKKSFKIAKCKTSLKLATSRIKLMRNKKGVQINQMKKELAQLLESGQDRTARIRVEHVIREEKMVAAYDLIEIYCELIVARLPIIESQKTCPIDLKEAVTSVIFAAPRCLDLPELADVKKNFTAKYGKEFVSAAVELRPDCGVSRMLVEKLSAVAPDLQTKIKVLSAVAKEHNINWDPTAFEEKESKPPDDLLNGPTYFENTSTISVESPKIQTSSVPNVHGHEGNPNEHVDFAQQNKRFTLDAQNVTDADTGGVQKSSASTTHDDMRPSGLGSGMMNTSQSFHSNNRNSSSGRENWNMEFKDATSAAQAAAESAERASFAARAAAQLSSQGKITRQYSTESYSSEQRPQVYSEHTDQHNFKDSFNKTSYNDRKPKIQNQQMGPTDIHTSSKDNKKSSSLRSRNDSIKENSVNHFETHEISSIKESRGQFTNGDDEGSSKSANVGYYKEGVVKKQPIIAPSRTHSTTIGNELNDSDFYDQKTGQTTKYDGAHSDDESDSDDGPRFDTGFEYDEGEAKSFFPSPDRESFRLSDKKLTSISSPKKNTSNTMVRVDSPKSVDHSVKFDLSDGPDSETETEVTKSSVGRTKVSTSPPKVNPTKSRIELTDLVETVSSCHKESDDFDTGKDLNYGALTGGLRHKGGLKYPPYTETAVKESPKKTDPASKQSSFSPRASRLDNQKPIVSKSSSESDSDDNNETFLTGGLRHRSGLKYPAYTKIAVKESPIKTNQAIKQNSFSPRASRLDNKKPIVSKSSSESDLDDHNKTFPVQKSFKTRSQFAPPDKFFSNDETDSEEEVSLVSKRTSTGKVHLGPGLSRRTKGQVEPASKTVISNPGPNHESLEPSSSSSAEQNLNTRSKITKSPIEPRPDPVHFENEPSRTKPGSKISESAPNPAKKIVEPGKTEGPKTMNLSSETKLEANNAKKPSHVHPKLPDYDSLAARIQALSKMNHQ